MLICAEFCGAALVGEASRRDFLWARHAFLPKERTSAGGERQRLIVPPDLLWVGTRPDLKELLALEAMVGVVSLIWEVK